VKSPHLAFFYSILVPGLGQLYLGERAKGWTLLCMTAGVWISLVISHTPLSWLFMGLIYLAVMIPATSDAFQAASGRSRAFAGDSIFYVITMLLVIGPFAVPLLWQSAKFSKIAKIIWTIIVVLIAFLAIGVLMFMASSLDQLIKQSQSS